RWRRGFRLFAPSRRRRVWRSSLPARAARRWLAFCAATRSTSIRIRNGLRLENPGGLKTEGDSRDVREEKRGERESNFGRHWQPDTRIGNAATAVGELLQEPVLKMGGAGDPPTGTAEARVLPA